MRSDQPTEEAHPVRDADIDTLAADYAAHFAGLRKLLVQYRPLICPFDDIFEHIPKAASLLDIGCGSGFTLYSLAKQKNISSLMGIDANTELVSKGRTLLSSLLPDREVDLLATHSTSDWPDKQYDLVTMIDVMHHIPVEGQVAFLKEAAQRVAPGGLLVYKDMAEKPFFYALSNRVHDLVLAQQWINYFPLKSAEKTLTELGFVEVANKKRRMLWYSHEILIMKRP